MLQSLGRGREALMAKVTGLGGSFLRVADPKALYAWYEEHLGISGAQVGLKLARMKVMGRSWL